MGAAVALQSVRYRFLLRSDEIRANIQTPCERRTVLGDPTCGIPPARTSSRAVAKVQSKGSYETRCPTSLISIFCDYAVKVATKKQLEELFPELGRRQFDRVFRRAVEETGACAWSAAGRPTTLDSAALNRIGSQINRDGVS